MRTVHVEAEWDRASPRAETQWLERLAALPELERRVRIPTITDPRGTDFAAALERAIQSARAERY